MRGAAEYRTAGTVVVFGTDGTVCLDVRVAQFVELEDLGQVRDARAVTLALRRIHVDFHVERSEVDCKARSSSTVVIAPVRAHFAGGSEMGIDLLREFS
jgi:hypothetical protein